MKIEDLQKGSNLEVTSGTVGPTEYWNFVLRDRQIVGIGVFLEDNTIATSAVAVDEEGFRTVLNELNGEHPTDQTAKEHLEKLFNHYFPNAKVRTETCPPSP